MFWAWPSKFQVSSPDCLTVKMWATYFDSDKRSIYKLIIFQGKHQRVEKLEVNLQISQDTNKELQKFNIGGFSPTTERTNTRPEDNDVPRPLSCDTLPWQHCPCPEHNDAVDSNSLESMSSAGNQSSGREIGTGPALDRADHKLLEDRLMYRPLTLGCAVVALCYQPSILTILIIWLLLWAKFNCIVIRFSFFVFIFFFFFFEK